MDSHPLARDLAHDHLQHPPRPPRLCFSGRSERHIFSHRDGARHLYIIPIALRRIFRHHPEVHFKPGPFYLGDGLLGWAVNLNCIVWTLFVSVIFSLPTVLPVTKDTMNYAAVITGGVVLLAMYAVPPPPFFFFFFVPCTFLFN